MQGMAEDALVMASDHISYALACAGRHAGPCTTSLTVYTQAVRHSLVKDLGQPGTLTSPSILANVDSAELILESLRGGCDNDNDDDDDASIGQFASRLLQRLPNLVAATFCFYTKSEVSFTPLYQLEHLELDLKNHLSLETLPFAAWFPELETARISALSPCMVPELDVSGVQAPDSTAFGGHHGVPPVKATGVQGQLGDIGTARECFICSY